MKIPYFTDYFSNLGAELIAIQKLNYIIKELNKMATTQEVLDAVGAAEARVAGNITAAIADLQVKLDTGAALTAADLDKVLAAVNGIGATPPAPV